MSGRLFLDTVFIKRLILTALAVFKKYSYHFSDFFCLRYLLYCITLSQREERNSRQIAVGEDLDQLCEYFSC